MNVEPGSPPIALTPEARAAIAAHLAKDPTARYVRIFVGHG